MKRLSWLILLLALISCTPAGSVTLIADTPTPSSATRVIVDTPTLEVSPTLEITPTLTPELKFPSTLSPTESASVVLAMYENNGGCELPCWWGIEPGKTNWQDAYLKFAPLGRVYVFMRENTQKYYFRFTFPPEIDPEGHFTLGPTGPGIYFQNNIVTAISINAGWIESGFDYSLAGILKILGKPDEIWLNLTPLSQWFPHYYIELVYFQKGILFTGTGKATVEGNLFTICNPDLMMGTGGLYAYPPNVFLWQPAKDLTYEELGRY